MAAAAAPRYAVRVRPHVAPCLHPPLMSVAPAPLLADQIRPLLDAQVHVGPLSMAYFGLSLLVAAWAVRAWYDAARGGWRADDRAAAVIISWGVPVLASFGLLPYSLDAYELRRQAAAVAVAVTDPAVRLEETDGQTFRLVRPRAAVVRWGEREAVSDEVLLLSRAEVLRLRRLRPAAMTALATR